MKKYLILLLIFISLPVQAQRYKQWGNNIIDKHNVTDVYIEGNYIYIKERNRGFTILYQKDRQQKLKQFKAIEKWLNEKD